MMRTGRALSEVEVEVEVDFGRFQITGQYLLYSGFEQAKWLSTEAVASDLPPDSNEPSRAQEGELSGRWLCSVKIFKSQPG